MTCCVCHKPIAAKAQRSYAYVDNGKGGTRKVYACSRCMTKRFDEYLDKPIPKRTA